MGPLPVKDEWYKAAYHKNDGVTGNYWEFPTGSDVWPSNDLIDPDPGNNATFYIMDYDWTIGAPYFRTEVGAHENSDSPYGTFDQGGNVYEWNEAVVYSWNRGKRGGSYGSSSGELRAARRPSDNSEYESTSTSFRVVAQVPEPATLCLLAVGWLLTVRRQDRVQLVGER